MIKVSSEVSRSKFICKQSLLPLLLLVLLLLLLLLLLMLMLRVLPYVSDGTHQ